MAVPYLLDTTALLQWVRNGPQAAAIEEQFELLSSPTRPLICEVSLGEILALSRGRGWGPAKVNRIAEIERLVVTIDISDRNVLEAFADLSTLAQRSNWSLFHGKNDLWVGAAAKVAGAHLLTMDKDFAPLCGRPGWQVTLLDVKTGRPLPHVT